MTTRATDVNTHPDLVELRSRYEQAGQSALGGLLTGVLLLAGLYLVVSPWVIQPISQFGIAASNMITGIALALLAVGWTRSFARLHGIAWVSPVIGAWVIASPWVTSHESGLLSMGPAHLLPVGTTTWLSNVVTGIVVVVAGIGLTVFGGHAAHRH